MEVIPVIDLKGGVVVHARLGQRDAYRPIRSRLCSSAEPPAVIAAFLALHPFRTVYVADLDAIQGAGANRPALEGLRQAFPAIELWVDSGLADPDACRAWLDRDLGHLVVGSESQRDGATLGGLCADDAVRERVILSLDFQGDRFLGPATLMTETAAWPERIIAMTLARVGSGGGPDLERLRRLRAAAPTRRLFAAGGVRSADDLTRLAKEGVHGALVASALHDGAIDGAALARVRTGRPDRA